MYIHSPVYPSKMLIFLLSPAKSLDMSACHVAAIGSPEFRDEATFLASHMASLTQLQLKSLLEVSKELASLNFERYSHFTAQPTKVKEQLSALLYCFFFKFMKSPQHNEMSFRAEIDTQHSALLEGEFVR